VRCRLLLPIDCLSIVQHLTRLWYAEMAEFMFRGKTLGAEETFVLDGGHPGAPWRRVGGKF